MAFSIVPGPAPESNPTNPPQISRAYDVVTARILEKLESGVAPWRQTWSGKTTMGRARNLFSGSCYRGINAILTGCQGFDSPYWVTFKQAQNLGGTVRKGERGTPIVFLGDASKTDSETGESQNYKFLRYYTAFNLSQCDGIESPDTAPIPTRDFVGIPACESVVEKSPMSLEIRHGGGRAYYSPSFDFIAMPEKSAFESDSAYYATLFHELTHATGHDSRLSRGLEKLAAFGSHDYSKEELIAEMGAAFLCAETGIETATLENSAAYLAGWIRVLRGDPRLVISAAAQAQRAAALILNR
jgi:antirestriction protein ArdC